MKFMGISNIKIAEIGIHTAKSPKVILKACNKIISEYIGIDPYRVFKGSMCKTEEECTEIYVDVMRRLRKYPQFRLIRETSAEAHKVFPDEYFDFIYIDAAHDYEHVYEDITLWLPKLKKDGIFAGHDYWKKFPGVVKAVQEIFGRGCERGKGTLFIARFKDGEYING